MGPVTADNPAAYQVRAVSVTLATDRGSLKACAPFMNAEIGADFGYTP